MSNYLALRSSAAPTLTVNLLTISTLSGSTIYGSTMFTSSIVASGLTLSTITVSTINGSLPGTGSGTGSSSTMISIGASTTQSNNFSGGSFTSGWGSTLTGLTAITDVTVSQSGQYQLAVQNGSSTIRTSANSGITWGTLTGTNGLPAGATAYPQATATGVPAYTSISASATGQYQLASVRGGLLYVCANGLSSTPTFTAVGMGTPNIYFPMEGSVTDVMSGNTPTVTGSPGYVTGVVGSQALNLTNTMSGTATQYIRQAINLTATPNFTVSFWFNIQQAATAQTVLLDLGTSSAESFGIFTNSNGSLYYAYQTSAAAWTLGTFAASTTVNTWYQITIIYTYNGICSIYLNNILAASFSVNFTLYVASNLLSIGTYTSSTSGAFKGYIDDFRFYNSAVTFSPIVPMNWSQTAVSATGQYMLAACASGGVFQSSNYGVTWTQVTASVLNPGQAPYSIGGPPIRPNSTAATSNTWTVNGLTWVASSSSVYSGYATYSAFNAASGSEAWNSAANYNAAGITTTTTTTVIGTGAIYGEWLQIQSYVPYVMSSYAFKAGGYWQFPKNYTIVGSNDGTTWYPLQTVTLSSSPAGTTNYAGPTNTISVNQSGSHTMSTANGSAVATCSPTPYASNSFLYFRLITTTIFGVIGNPDCASIGEWYIDFASPLPLYVAPSSTTVAPQLTGLASSGTALTASWTAGGVSWAASASSVYSATYPVSYAFNNTASSFWTGSGAYTTTGNTASSTTFILGGIGSTQGDWLQIQSSIPLVMPSYQFAMGGAVNYMPKNYYIVGSNDGTTWYPIQYGAGGTLTTTPANTLVPGIITVYSTGAPIAQTFGSSTITTTAYSTAANAYTYFRLIGVSAYNTGVIEIGEWYINFSAPAPSNTSLLPIIPQQAGLAAASWTTTNGVSWVASSSSIYQSLYYAYYAFNNILTGTTFASNETYTASGATQAGSPSTAVSGLSAQVGEWIQLQSSVPLVMNSYIFSCGGAINLFPKTYIIVGSNNGTTWYPIQSVSFSGNPYSTILTSWQQSIIVNLSGPQTITAQNTVTATTVTYGSTTNAYTYFRIIATSTNGTLFELAESYINFTAAVPNPVNALAISSTNTMVSTTGAVAPNRTALTSSGNALTTSPWMTSGVTWIAKASSVYDPAGSTAITNAFNNSSLVSAGEWVPLSTYTSATNNSGQLTTIQTIGNVTGEWLQIQSSVPLVMSSYRFGTGNGTARLPKTYYIVGSNDGLTNWYPIQYVAGGAITSTAGYTDVPGLILVNSGSTQTFGSSTIATTIYSTTTNAYTYFRLICLTIYNTGNDVVSLGEWYINFQTGSIQSSANNGSTWTSALTLNTPVLATAGSYVITSYKQIAYLYSNGISGAYTTPTLTGINADIDDASISASGQYMAIVTLGTTNNVFYSIDYGVTWTALTVGSSALISCAMSADGSYVTVANATAVYTLNRNTQGFSVAIGNQAGAVNQAQNAIAIGNKAGLINQSANSIVLNATGNSFDVPFSGFYVAPITNYTSSYASSFNLLGYGSDSQIVQSSALTVLQNGYIGIGTANSQAPLHINQSLSSASFYNTFGIASTMPAQLILETPNIHRLYMGSYYTGGQGEVSVIQSSSYFNSTDHAGTLLLNPNGGNVGVGTTSTAYPLHVVGNINLTGSILYNGVAIATGAGSIWNTGAGGVAYYNGGNVGIGTATPGFRLVADNGGTAGIHTVLQASSIGSGTTVSILLGKSLAANNCGTFLWNHIADGSAANYVGIGYYNGDNRLNVTCSGNVGIGLTAPGYALDVVGTIQSQTAFQSSPNVNNAGMGPMQACYLGQYGAAASRATSVRIGDIVGAAYYMCTGSYNLSFYKDVSGANAVPALQIIGLNATNATPNVYVQNSLGIGSNAPVTLLNVNGVGYSSSTITNVSNFNGTPSLVLTSSNANANSSVFMGCNTMGGGGGTGIVMWRGGSYDTYLQVYTCVSTAGTAGAVTGGPYLGNGATSWTNASDRRLKEDWQEIDGVLDKLSALTTGTFQWKNRSDKVRSYGLIAQEVQVHFPEMISTDSQGYLGIQYTEMIPVAIKAIQMLTKQVNDLKSQVASLSESNTNLLAWAQSQGFSG